MSSKKQLSLKELNAFWQQKLKESGFKDIETKDRKGLREWHGSYFRNKYSPLEFKAKQRYYELANELLQRDVFTSSRDKTIWYRHAQGNKDSQIAKFCKVSLRTVQRVVSKYRKFILGISLHNVKL